MDTKKQNQVKKILKICLNTLFYAAIVVLLLFSIANMRVKTTADIPNIFGRGFLAVVSDSMNGDKDDSFQSGDLIVVNMLNDSERDKLQVGDIVTFYDSELRALNTHRIVEIDGDYVFTQGDKVAMDPARKYDPDALVNDETAYELMTKDEVLAVRTKTWNGAGKTLVFLQSPTGFALFIVLPTFLVLIYEGVILVKNILKVNRSKMEEKHQKEMEAIQKEMEKEKENMRAQLLEEMKQEEKK
jgi:signal peptidase